MYTSPPDTPVFFIDSGATDHFVSPPSALTNLRRLPRPMQVYTANSTTAACDLTGELQLFTPNGHLTVNAICAPSFPNSLISVSQLTSSTGGKCIFTRDSWHLEDASGNILLQGTQANGLYALTHSPQPDSQQPSTHSAATANVTQPKSKLNSKVNIWHHRLNHPGKRVSKLTGHLYSLPIDPVTTFCDTCATSKMTKTPSRSVKPDRHKARALLERLHCDIAGPMPLSRRGNRYYITFTDELSRYTLAYPMKLRSEAPVKLTACISELQQLTPHLQIRELRTDNAPELAAGDTARICATHHIRMTTSAPYSPAQNGIAERVNRTIKEAMRIGTQHLNTSLQQRQYQLPTRLDADTFWDDALDSAVYIKNRTATTATSAIPIETLLGKPADISGLRTFGCLAYVLDQLPSSSIAPRSFPTLLIGFKDNHIYKCYDPKTGRTHISKDVLFDELSAIPASDQQPANGPYNQPQQDGPHLLTDSDSDDGSESDAASDSDIEHISSSPRPLPDTGALRSDNDDDSDNDSDAADASPSQSAEALRPQPPHIADMPPLEHPDDAAEPPATQQPNSLEDRLSGDRQPNLDDQPSPAAPPVRKSDRPTRLASRPLDDDFDWKSNLPTARARQQQTKRSQANLTLTQHEVPSVTQAWQIPEWRAAMTQEFDSQIRNGT